MTSCQHGKRRRGGGGPPGISLSLSLFSFSVCNTRANKMTKVFFSLFFFLLCFSWTKEKKKCEHFSVLFLCVSSLVERKKIHISFRTSFTRKHTYLRDCFRILLLFIISSLVFYTQKTEHTHTHTHRRRRRRT